MEPDIIIATETWLTNEVKNRTGMWWICDLPAWQDTWDQRCYIDCHQQLSQLHLGKEIHWHDRILVGESITQWTNILVDGADKIAISAREKHHEAVLGNKPHNTVLTGDFTTFLIGAMMTSVWNQTASSLIYTSTSPDPSITITWSRSSRKMPGKETYWARPYQHTKPSK